MTNQEKYDLIKEVCEQVRTALKRESETLSTVADDWKDKGNLDMYLQLSHASTTTSANRICVSAVESKMVFELFEKVTEDDDITI